MTLPPLAGLARIPVETAWYALLEAGELAPGSRVRIVTSWLRSREAAEYFCEGWQHLTCTAAPVPAGLAR